MIGNAFFEYISKDNIKKIPYLGIYESCFSKEMRSLLYVYDDEIDGSYHTWTIPLVVSRLDTFSYRTLDLSGNIHLHKADMDEYASDQLKEICPPLKYTRDTIIYSFPEVIRPSFTKTNPSAYVREDLRDWFDNKTYNYYCLYNRSRGGTINPVGETASYIRNFFGGYKGIKVHWVYNYNSSARIISIASSTTYIPWD